MIRKAIAISIMFISAGVGIGIAISSRDAVELKRRKANIRHQETVNTQKMALIEMLKKSGLDSSTIYNVANKACQNVDDGVYGGK